MKKTILIMCLIFCAACFGQRYIVDKSYLLSDKKEELQKNNMIKFITQTEEGLYVTFHNDRSTETFLWADLERIGNKLIYKIPDGALYVFEYEKDILKHLYLTIELLEGNTDIGYEKNLRKFRYDVY